jgi:predicted trehalose synthase
MLIAAFAHELERFAQRVVADWTLVQDLPEERTRDHVQRELDHLAVRIDLDRAPARTPASRSKKRAPLRTMCAVKRSIDCRWNAGCSSVRRDFYASRRA